MILDILLNPGIAIGCLAGFGIAAGLNWMFPEKDLFVPQATIIVVTTFIGLFIEFYPPGREK